MFFGLVTIANVKYSLIGAKKINIMDERNSGPYDADVEYLESDGKQYIDTGYVFSNGYTYKFSIMPITSYSIYYWLLKGFIQN